MALLTLHCPSIDHMHRPNERLSHALYKQPTRTDTMMNTRTVYLGP